jgi:hypothetical protein
MYAYLYKPLDAAPEVVVEVFQQCLPPLEGIAGDLHWQRAGSATAESCSSWSLAGTPLPAYPADVVCVG